MPFNHTWNADFELLPTNTEDVNLGAGRIRDLKDAISERLERDHSWLGDANDGLHLQVTLPERTDPTNIANTGILYTKDVSGVTDLFYVDSAGRVKNIGNSVIVINKTVSVTTVVSTITETTLYSYSVPANTLGTDRKLRLTILGDHLYNHGGSPAFITRAKYGAETFAVLAVYNGTASANRAPLKLVFELYGSGATNTQKAHAHGICGGGGSTTGVVETNGWDTIDTNNETSTDSAIAQDSTGALDLVVTIQHSASSANQAVRLHSAVLELVP